MSDYFSGCVDWFDDRAGRGYIIPNESERFNGKLQFQSVGCTLLTNKNLQNKIVLPDFK